MSIYNRNGQNNQGNAYLLLLSAALYQHALNNTVSGGSQSGELTKVLNDLADDFVDGDLEASSDILDGLVLAIQQLDPAGVITNLENRSNEVLGQQLEVPDFSQFIGQFIITYPAAESELSDITTIRTEVPSGLRNVTLDLMVDGLVVDSITEAPYEFTWNPYYWSSETSTRHTLLVKARNSLGAEIISNLVPVSVLPESRNQLSLTSPSNGQSLTNIDQATLTWNSLADADAYQTQVAADSSFSTTIHDAQINENQYLATNLKVGSYFWRVGAIDNDGNTGNWSEVNHFNIVAPDAPALTSPINSLAIRDTDKPTLNWENVTNAESYIVQVSQLSDFSVISQQQDTTSTEWTTLPLDAGNYYWRVKSIDSANHESEFSHAGHFKVTGPVAPVLTLPLNNELIQSTSTVSLNWNAADYAHRYRIQLSETSDFSVLTNEQLIETNSFTTEALSIGRYFWRVKSINSHGYEGDYSTSRFFNISGPDAPTLQLPSFGNIIRDTNTPVLTWSSVGFAESYIVQISTHNNFASLVEQKNSLTANAITSELSAGNYFWRVKSVNTSGNESAFSEVSAFQIAGPLPPEEITSDWTSNGTEYDVSLNWQGAEFATGYEVQIASDIAFSSDLTSLNISIETGMTTLEIGEYFLRIRSLNSRGILGEWSDTYTFDVGLFTTRLGGSRDEKAKRIIRSKDNGYIILAYTSSTEVSDTVDSQGDDWIIKLNEQGTMEWQYISNASGRDRFNEIVELSDGSIVTVGHDWGSRKGVALRLDSTGNLLWEVLYRPDSIIGRYDFVGVVEFDNKLYVSTVERGNGSIDNYYLHTVSIDGANVSGTSILSAPTDVVLLSAGDLLVSSAGNLVIAGHIRSNDFSEDYYYDSVGAYMLQLDSNLDTLSWWDNIGEYLHIGLDAVQELENGKFAILGYDVYTAPVMTYIEPDGLTKYKNYQTSDFGSDLQGLNVGWVSKGNSGIYSLLNGADYSGVQYPLILVEYNQNATETDRHYFIDEAGYSRGKALLRNTDGTITLLFEQRLEDNGNYDVVVRHLYP